jgi:hypothetical protein
VARYRIRQIGLDGNDLTTMIEFWSAALGYELEHRVSGTSALTTGRSWPIPKEMSFASGALANPRCRPGRQKRSRALELAIATKLLNNLFRALRCDSDHGPHRVRQRDARHI